MPECNRCGAKVLFLFTCRYCGGRFCEEHRLPENHQCVSLPKGLFWYQKRTHEDEIYYREKQNVTVNCPKCNSRSIYLGSFSKDEVSYQCEMCHYKWVAPRIIITELKEMNIEYKICTHCKEMIPLNADFCSNCRKKQ